jgi:hypothetical protein
VTVLGEPGDDLRADQPGATDDDDLHGSRPPVLVCSTCPRAA